MDTKLIAQLQQLTEDILNLMNVPAEVVVETGQGETVRVGITVQENNKDKVGLLIGHHGATLYSLQSILSLVINQGQEEWIRLSVDVNDYREQRDGAIRAFAKRSAEKARFLEEEVTLPPMNAFERRIVHMEISEMEDMESESIGEPPRRRVVIRPQL
jgi:spoIIIJ-associated protein